jgi:LysR family nitrogen assimilation transcriptional regulator
MNLRQLRYFVEIAELRSFSRASASLHIAQSALSRQIQQLEDELGTPLLERNARGVSLTWAGERFLERVQSLLNGLAAAKSELASLGEEPRGLVSFGVPPSMFETVTLPLITSYRKSYPLVQLRVREGISADLCEAVASGLLDTAIVSDHEDLRHLRTRRLLNEGLWVLGRVEGRRPARGPMSLSKLASLPLIVTSRPNALRAILDEALAAAGLAWKPVIESNSARLSIALAESGAGWAVLPYSGAHRVLREKRFAGFPIEDLKVDWVLVSHRAQPSTPPTLRLQSLLEEILRRATGMADWRLDESLRRAGGQKTVVEQGP